MRPPQDPKKRIHEILDAAEYLFATEGYERTTIKDISQRMGVAQGMLYYYFKSKHQVLDGVMERRAEEALSEVYRIQNLRIDAYDKLSNIMSALLQVAKGPEGRFLELMYMDSVVPLTLCLLEKIGEMVTVELEKFIGEKGSGKEIEVAAPKVTIFFILSMINNLIDSMRGKLELQEWLQITAMAENLVAVTLDCEKSRIHIKLA